MRSQRLFRHKKVVSIKERNLEKNLMEIKIIPSSTLNKQRSTNNSP